MIGCGAGHRGSTLNGVQPVHTRRGRNVAAGGEIAGVPDMTGAIGQEIGIQGEHNVCLVKAILDVEAFTKGGIRSFDVHYYINFC